ncbi:MAG TPA: hypothetical protein PLY72_02230 [Candidatus Obscuribacter sp.]|nr:hypothetical protein [Candidatus Obscuribacter sp.]
MFSFSTLQAGCGSNSPYPQGSWRLLSRALLTFFVFSSTLVLVRMLEPALLSALAAQLPLLLLQDARRAMTGVSASLLVFSLALPVFVGSGICRRFILRQSGLTIGLLAAIVSLSVVLRGLQFSYCIDDAYIDFRYILNVLSGYGLSYQGETSPPLGVSSPLHLLMLGLLCRLFSNQAVEQVSQSLNLSLDVIAILLLFALVRKLTAPVGSAAAAWASLLACALYGISSYSIFEVFRGKETPLLVSLLLSYLLATLAGRCRLRSFSAGLIALTRPEGLLFFLTDSLSVFLSFLKEETLPAAFFKTLRRQSLSLALLAAVILFTLVSFGALVPSGMTAKWLIYDRPDWFGFAQLAQYLWRSLFAVTATIDGAHGGFFSYGLSLASFVFLTTLAVAPFYGQKGLRVYVSALFVLGAFFGFLNAVIFVFPWYFAWWALLFPLSWALLFAHLATATRGLRPASLAAMLALLVGLLSWNYEPGDFVLRPTCCPALASPCFRLDVMQGRLPAYCQAAEYINNVAKPGELVAAGELGILGYKLRKVRVLDLHGIVSPEMLPFYRDEKGRYLGRSLITFPGAFVERFRPDWIVVYDVFCESLFREPCFQRDYKLERLYPFPFYGSRGLFVFRRQPAP